MIRTFCGQDRLDRGVVERGLFLSLALALIGSVKRVRSKSLFDAGTCRRSRDVGSLDDFRAFFRTLPER